MIEIVLAGMLVICVAAIRWEARINRTTRMLEDAVRRATRKSHGDKR